MGVSILDGMSAPNPTSLVNLASDIKAWGKALGFQQVGIAGIDLAEDERYLSAWLAAGRFTVADLLMADVLRVPKVREAGEFPALRSYVDRVCARPAFKRAYDAQMAHFARGDR